jgi:hypothetical protein
MSDPISRDIDWIIEKVQQRLPGVLVQQHWVPNPAVDDDGVWFFRFWDVEKDIQIESSFGMCPFMVEHSEMRSASEAEFAHTVEEAVEKIILYLSGLQGNSQ